jgi:hypothetical protein
MGLEGLNQQQGTLAEANPQRGCFTCINGPLAGTPFLALAERIRAAFNRMRGLSGPAQLGSPTYDIAKQVVAALQANDYWSAFGAMSGLSPADLAEVSKKSIALGADPEVIQTLVASLGQTEVINVTSSAPPAAKAPFPTWAKVAIGVSVAGVAFGLYKQASKAKTAVV